MANAAQKASPLSGATTPWWRGATIYQVYPRSFRDSNDDGVGDLRGLIEGLDYIASLGVDAVWISPFFASPMRDFGYDVSDFCAVDPIFGELADFDALIERAHEAGLRIIIDQVYSHTSDEHAWFKESRQSRDGEKADWYVWADPKPDGAPPNNWQSVFGGGAWEWDARRRQYYLHNFLRTQPDLNVRNRAVQDALLAVARFWLDRGVDGFRLDAINFAFNDAALRDNPPSGAPTTEVTRPFDMQRHLHNKSQPDVIEFVERLQGVVGAYPDRFTVAEIVGAEPHDEMKSFIAGDDRLSSAYGFDFLYADQISPDVVRRAIEIWDEDADGWPAWAFSNHDAPRAVSRWAAPADREAAAKLYLLLLLSLRGNVFLYQGEELGLPQAKLSFDQLQDPEAIANWPRTLGRDGARTPIPWSTAGPYSGFSRGAPWLPIDKDHSALSIERQTNDTSSCLNFTRAAQRIRAGSDALCLGSTVFLDSPKGVLAFVREHGPADRIACVYNMSAAPVAYALNGTAEDQMLITNAAGPPSARPPSNLPPLTGYWARLAP